MPVLEIKVGDTNGSRRIVLNRSRMPKLGRKLRLPTDKGDRLFRVLAFMAKSRVSDAPRWVRVDLPDRLALRDLTRQAGWKRA